MLSVEKAGFGRQSACCCLVENVVSNVITWDPERGGLDQVVPFSDLCLRRPI